MSTYQPVLCDEPPAGAHRGFENFRMSYNRAFASLTLFISAISDDNSFMMESND
jgi:hypothetical protein